MDIPSPTLPLGHPQRQEECSVLLAMAITGLWDLFEEAGWSEEEFNRALIEEGKRTERMNP